MKNKDKAIHTDLFSELERWSLRENSFSLNDFLNDRNISFSEFEKIANSNKRFMKIWGKSESRAWENLTNALFTNSLPRSQIAKYIKEDENFRSEDPEEVMRNLESVKDKLDLHEKAMSGDIEALIQCSLNRGIIGKEDY